MILPHGISIRWESFLACSLACCSPSTILKGSTLRIHILIHGQRCFTVLPGQLYFYCFSTLEMICLLTGKTPFADMFWLGNSFAGWGILFFLGVAPTLGGFGLYTLSLRYLSPTTSNLIATLEPAFTAIWAYFLLNETFNGAHNSLAVRWFLWA